MAVLWTIPERCRRCYSCVRDCPAKAIQVVAGQARVIPERCIACGNCVKVCAQGAKRVRDDIEEVQGLLAGDKPVFACIAPSFPAAFDTVEPGRVIQAIRALGFAEVWEVAFGAELVAPAYLRLFNEARRTGKPVIATPCPAVVAYVEKYLPELHEYLAPIVSPKVAVARAIRQKHNGNVRVVFMGPCVAKKQHLHTESNSALDAVLTFDELHRMFVAAGVDPAEQPVSSFDGPRAHIGRTFPISGGLLKTAGMGADLLDGEIVGTEGKNRVLATLKDLAAGRSHALFYDLLFCEGCIDGPMMLNDLSVLARKELLVGHINDRARFVSHRELAESLAEYEGLDLTRKFERENLSLPQPAEEDILRTLERMRKALPNDQLNCGACGYPTCREKAIAVCQGLAEPAMCLPFLVDELEQVVTDLRQSHEDLATTQKQLLRSERLASMGQLSAGIAHELNNPLGTILLYSHMLMREVRDDRGKEDLQLIVSEATRCKDIVRGLLDFARKSRVSKAPADMKEVIDEIASIAKARADEMRVVVTTAVAENLPVLMIDRVQLRQALVNVAMNAVDSMPGGGSLHLAARLSDSGDDVRIEITDTGCGIPPENLSRLFTPFFTTKAMGKGTGLGLAITYGVIKMHSGDITVDSEVGKGTTFTIRLPVRTAEAIGDDGSAREYRVEEQYFR
jgi:signal transduction histidine kinase/NAD-dependent dihydropyrimidine dehydrogenase PreA subunit